MYLRKSESTSGTTPLRCTLLVNPPPSGVACWRACSHVDTIRSGCHRDTDWPAHLLMHQSAIWGIFRLMVYFCHPG